MKLSSRQVAIMAVFAAIYAIVSRLPGIPMFGGAGKIEPVVILDPIVGILLGPWIGGITSLLGNFLAWIIPSVSFYGLLNLPVGPVAAIVSGSLARKTKNSNWKVSAIIYAILMALWYLTPTGREAFYFPFMHWGAFVLVLVFREKTHSFLNADTNWRKVLGATICSFAGIMANHMTGSLIFIGSVGSFVSLKAIKDSLKALGFFWLKSGLPQPPEEPLAAIFTVFIPIIVVERVLFTILTVYLAYGLMIALRKSGLLRMG